MVWMRPKWPNMTLWMATGSLRGQPPVGASLLAMDVNDNACFLNKRVALESIASELAPTGISFQSTKVHAMTTASSRPPTAG
jgi:hypothetical protein